MVPPLTLQLGWTRDNFDGIPDAAIVPSTQPGRYWVTVNSNNDDFDWLCPDRPLTEDEVPKWLESFGYSRSARDWKPDAFEPEEECPEIGDGLIVLPFREVAE